MLANMAFARLGAALMVGVLAGCTSHSTPLSLPTPRLTAPGVAFNARSACTAGVPGSGHALLTTVAAVRQSSMGLVRSPAVQRFAPNEKDTAPAAFCYRWVRATSSNEWWGVSPAGSAVRIGTLGGLYRDVGVFVGR